jgi:amino acid adenylation domain-containing protein
MSNIAKRITELSPEKRRLLGRLLKREQIDVSRAVITPREPGSQPLPLSFAQQRLWFLSQLEPDSPFYNLPSAFRLSGALDVRALERSLSEIIRRHESLRTTFHTIGGEPRQLVNPAAPFFLPVEDLSHLPPVERDGEVHRLSDEEAQRVFDLTSDLMLRARLLRLAVDEHVLLVTMHHISSDGWSLGIFARELSALYTAYRQGLPSPLEELPVQYADYALWQRQWLRAEVLEGQLSYWRERLGGELPVVELPSDRPRPPVQSYRGAEEWITIGEEVAEGLRGVANACGATLYMTLLAAFTALLHRYTSQTDILVGSPVAGRTRAETEPLIGFFVNTLVLRTDLSADPTFRELVGRIREVTLGAYAHQELPFEKLVEELQPERDLSRHPLFQVVFTLQNAATEEPGFSEMSLDVLETETGTAKFDLRLAVTEDADGLTLAVRYSTDLFDAARIRRVLGHYRNLLAAAAADPAQSISVLPILDEDERRDALTRLNAAREFYQSPLCLHQLFERQAASRPEATAVVYDGERLTYGELNRRADKLARRLRRLGAGPESVVGVLFERSAELVVALLGVLKAGAAYLPLDPQYPPDRLAFMLKDSRAEILVTRSGHAATLGDASRSAARVVCLDAEDEEVATEGGEDVSGPLPENLAYVIYTSGSTGRPKGVGVTHANVARLFEATAGWYQFGADDVWTLFHSYAFDFSVWELWGALLYGGRLVVVPYVVSRSPAEFLRLLRDERVTVLNQTPSAFRQLMLADEQARDAEPLSLRLVIFGGEALEPQSLRPWFERHGDARPRLVNMYGITETTVHVTYRPLVWADAEDATGSLIGVPIPDLELYVLDAKMRPQPLGVAGEIYVGGGGLARGYLGQPGLTATRFVPHPFSLEAGARLYRTGDLARLLDNGDVEYLGRADQQVKIRGFRIELGEIDAALARHPGVAECVVLAREDRPGDKRLVAYLVGRGSVPPQADELRSFLGRQLPEHMIPASFVTLDALPLNANGKVDRRALPAPGQERPELARRYVAPRTAAEALLAEMWQDILGLERVGIEDNFFELGGDSIKGAIFVNRLQEQLAEIVHVIVIFNAPTIAQLAAHLEEQYAEALRRLTGTHGGAASGDRREVSAEEGLRKARAGRDGGEPWTSPSAERIDAAKIERMRQLITPLARGDEPRPAVKNPPAVFVLSPPRSGSTLFRVMLAGHPALFAPPELELLSFNTLEERCAAFSGGHSFWLEGTIRALMEVRCCDASEAKLIMEELEARKLSTKECYGLLQEWLGDRMLVDKTPSYALDESVLAKAEDDFDGALYLHLIRHPFGMIRSFEEARLDQIFFRHPHSFTRRELAELVWLVSHQNIERFLERVPRERQLRVRFEELLEQPETVLRGVCAFLGLDFAPDMLRPYQEKARRMSDGIHAESRMLGDVKFHSHAGIEARVGHRWREQRGLDDLAPETWAMAAHLGYAAEPLEAASKRLEPLRPRARGEEALPLSFAQQRLWVICQLNPDSPVYHIPLALSLRGQLDVRALGRSLSEIIRRHESLRTTFHTIGGEPRQLVNPASPFLLPLDDLSHLAQPERDRALQQLTDDEVQRAFDLTSDLMLRARLLRLAVDEHVLLVTMHHISSDGWSLGIFARELSALYTAYRQGLPSPLEELAVQYADYALWQRQWLRAEVLEGQLSYWRERLGGELPVMELPSDRPRPPVLTYRGASENFELSESVAAQLKRVSTRHGATLYMTLLAAFKALLYRYTGQEDLIVGTPIAGRTRAETEPLIGFFVNTLVLRTRLRAEMSFGELLREVRDTTLGAFEHQDVPFEKLVEELQTGRDVSRHPFFQVVFTLRNATSETLELPGLQSRELEHEADTAKFDLILAIAEENDKRLTGLLNYNADLFDVQTVRRMVRHLQSLLVAIAEDSARPLSELPLMSEEERRQLLVEWNETRREYPRNGCVQELFEQQAARTPHAVALVYGDEEVSYAELNNRANQLARYLREIGVGPETPIGLLLERSIEMIVAHLAVLKAGGAYVPLDPQHPRERLAFILEDTRAPVLLTQAHLADALGERPAHSARVVCLDREGETLARQSQENPPNPVTADNLAYIMYTSGSTGRPKGVSVTHRGINRLVVNPDYITLGVDDTVLQISNVAFDAATFEIWGALLNGARLVGISRDDALSPHGLSRQLELHRVSAMFLTTALFHQTASEAPHIFSRVRNVIVGGEALEARWVREVLRAGPVERLLNAYGPTENTTFTTTHRIEEVVEGARSIPIGRPLSNTQVYILDKTMRPVPPGVVGELYAGGDGLARGYLHRPALTAERFLPHPFSDLPGARLYRTGDLARLLADGSIEFVGRVDDQVKIRGFRIELGEIEAALSEHPGVGEAAVVVRQDEGGEKRLVACFVPRSEAGATPGELRVFLKERLPDYMIPASFVTLDALPLNANGKVDRRALQALSADSSGRDGFSVVPRDALELQLTQIWEDVLNVHPVGVGDNFFELGGHSLLAVKLTAQIHKRLNQDLPLATLLQAQTIADLANVLRRRTTAAPQLAGPLAIQPRGRRPPFFCVHPVGGNVLCYYELARRLGEDQPFYGLQAPGLEGEGEPLKTVEELAAAHLDALRSIRPEGPYLLGGWSMGGVVAFEMARQLHARGEHVALVALLDSRSPVTFDKTAALDEDTLLWMFAYDLAGLSGVELFEDEGPLEGESFDERLECLLRRAVRAGATPAGVETKRLRQLFRVFEANLRAMLNYVPREYPGRVTLFRASEQGVDAPEDSLSGWGAPAAAGIELRIVPGNHYSMLRGPHAQSLGESLAACLGEAFAASAEREQVDGLRIVPSLKS